ncbi:MAG: glycosyltransferase family 4 protein [Anaerolineales bacterium]|nr:glycosyltransferase family 4 protein [Anaerolineales bacterium]
MKIALLTEKYTPDIGGLAISSERLARLLSSAGYEVHVFSPTGSLPPSEQRTLPSNGVVVTRFGTRKRTDDTLVDWFDLIVEEHACEPFDVLHAYFLAQAGFIATLAGRFLNIPSVVSIRGNDIERAAFDPARFSHILFALQHAGAVSANAQDLIRKAHAFHEREIILLPNGVDAERFQALKKNTLLAQRLGLQPGGAILPVIGFVGELREKKGLRTLLNGYAQINQRRPSVLLIVGEVRRGEDRLLFDTLCASIPQSTIVETGYIPLADLPAYYSLMDVFVHPSVRDGMPNALLEALACKRAVVVTPVGGSKDTIEDGVNGVFAAVNDSEMLAAKVLALLEDSELRAKLGANGRALVIERFTPQKELEANLKIYQQLGAFNNFP